MKDDQITPSVAGASCAPSHGWAALADAIENSAARTAYRCGMGAGEWESFLSKREVKILKWLAAKGHGTWGREAQPNVRISDGLSQDSATQKPI